MVFSCLLVREEGRVVVGWVGLGCSGLVMVGGWVGRRGRREEAAEHTPVN